MSTRRIGRRKFIASGLAIAMSAIARAESPGRIYRLAWFANFGPRSNPFHAAWRDELARNGYVEGRNLEIHPVPRWNGDVEKLNASVREMVEWKPDVIVAQFTYNTRVAQRATTSIPIVFFQVADPVAVGIVKNIAHPEGNTTGVSVHNLTLSLKRLELIRELLPNARRVAMIVDKGYPDDGFPPEFYRELRDAAKGLNLELIEEDVSQSSGGFDEAFEKVARARADMIVPLGPWPSLRVLEYDLVKLQSRHRIPVMGLGRTVGTRQDGLLVQFGADVGEMFRVGMELVAKVLGGTRPGEIPVQQLTRILLTVNLKTARELGIKVPKEILKRADRVIE